MTVKDVFGGFDVESPLLVVMGNNSDDVAHAVDAMSSKLTSEVTDDIIFASKTIEKRMEVDNHDFPPLTLVTVMDDSDISTMQYAHLDHIIDQGEQAYVGGIIGIVTVEDNIVDVAAHSSGIKSRVLSRSLTLDPEYVEKLLSAQQ